MTAVVADEAYASSEWRDHRVQIQIQCCDTRVELGYPQHLLGARLICDRTEAVIART